MSRNEIEAKIEYLMRNRDRASSLGEQRYYESELTKMLEEQKRSVSYASAIYDPNPAYYGTGTLAGISRNKQAFWMSNPISGAEEVTINYIEQQQNAPREEKKKDEKIVFPKPSEIVEQLNKKIVGQMAAKKALAIGAYFHYDRIRNSKAVFRKSNICMVGPTGTGKTYLLSNLALILKVPFVTVDATEMTPEGYYGSSAHDFIKQLKVQEENGYGKAEHAIVFIDEADKLASRGDVTAAKTTGVQQAFLKLLEGKERDGFDSSKVLFVMGGAFSGITSKRGYTGEIGTHDLISYGLMPEFVGRFPIITTLTPLGVPELKSILTEPEDSVIKEYTTIFKEHGVHLTFGDDAIDVIARAAMAMNTGARGLRAIVENILQEYLYILPDGTCDSHLTIGSEQILSQAA